MNRITKIFQNVRTESRKVFVPFLTAGFPRKEETVRLLLALEKAGADLIELGVPFSDPVADGPVIQESSNIALQNNVTLSWILETVGRFRQQSECPLMLFSYYNPVYQYGIDLLVNNAVEKGTDGILIPDLPIEESGDLKAVAVARDFKTVFLVAPTTPDDRLHRIEARSDDFVYLVSVTGTTGVRSALSGQIQSYVETMRSKLSKPFVVGFGISTPDDAARIGGIADGVVVGSALINFLLEHQKEPDLAKLFEEYARSFAQALAR